MKRIFLTKASVAMTLAFSLVVNVTACSLEGDSVDAKATKLEKTPLVANDAALGQQEQTAGAGKDTLTIIGVGDIMLGTNFPSKAYLPPNDGVTLLSSVRSLLRDADVTFGNLEGTLLTSGGTVKKCSDPSKCYAFRMPEHYVDYLVEAGFDMMSIANNHLGDFGETGRKKTRSTLEMAGIASAGLLAYPTCIYEKDGVKYGMAGFAPNTGTCDIRKIEAAAATVMDLSKQCDVVIVSFHGGAEGSKAEHISGKTEMFYGENRGNVQAFSHAMIDAGADIVFGHGPHVTRAMELYKDRFIAYSLGNFATYARFNLRGVSGIAPLVKVYTDSKGAFLKAHITPIIQKGEGIPEVDPTGAVIKRIRTLIEADIQNNQLIVNDNGWVTK